MAPFVLATTLAQNATPQTATALSVNSKRETMYSVTPSMYPEILKSEDLNYTAKVVTGFSGMQIRNGPYGAISSKDFSNGLVHFSCDNEMPTKVFLQTVDWVEYNAELLLDNALSSFVEIYNQMRGLVIESLIDEDPNDVVPNITQHTELKELCGIVAVHVHEQGSDGKFRFGIEFGCNWEEEHGGGVRFEGVELLKSGEASDAFEF